MDPLRLHVLSASAVPGVMRVAEAGAIPWELDLLKTLVATFIGAGLAFFTNAYFQRRQRERQQRIAGNVALAILSRQYGDFVIAKAAVEAELGRASSFDPPIPIWRAIQPTLFEMNFDLKFDFESLAFLVEDGNENLIEGLMDVETKYHELRRLLASHTKLASQIPHKFSNHGWTNDVPPSERAAEFAAGAALISELESLVKAIANRVATQEQTYISAGSQLEAFMKRKFRNKTFKFKALGAKAGLALLDKDKEN